MRVPFSSYIPLEQRERLYDLAVREDRKITELLTEAVELLLVKHRRAAARPAEKGGRVSTRRLAR